MKKFALIVAGGMAAIILLSSIGPLIGLLVSLAILYFIFKRFLKTESTGAKIALAIIGVFILMAAIQNAPAIIGVVAACVLYLVYKKWSQLKFNKIKEENDPFANFEKQWDELKHL